MSVPLAGYTTLRTLRSDARARVYVAERKRDHTRVVAKVFEPRDESQVARIEHAVRRLQELDDDAIVRPLAIERAGRALVVLLEYVDARDLDEAAAGRAVSVEQFTSWATSMAEILGRIHARRIVHRELKPNNVLIEHGSERVRFCDFGLSPTLDDERGLGSTPEQLVATLRYVSPERTGRTKAQVDSRSDLYSLGAMFYELLTGRPPFTASSPLELIHAHLAQQPRPPHELLASVPTQLSAIVIKLLEKAPEHRYQSATGLLADLLRFVAEREAGSEQPQFELGRDDRPQVLQLPHGLYGRARELELLELELDAAIEHGSRRTIVVSGGLGTGKSALLASIDAPLSRRGGYLALAQFDEHGNDTPYAGVIAAVQSLLAQLLGESDEQLERWRVHVRGALGPLAGVIASMVPELSWVIDAGPALAELPPTESQNRLQLAFARLLRGFCEVAPLVFAIDDAQWADAASVELLAALARERSGPALLLLGCRSDLHTLHTRAGARVLELAAELVDEGRACRRLELGPLDESSVTQLLADTFALAPERVGALAAHIGRRTNNLPLALRQLLQHLFEVGLLRPSAEGWQWELDAIAEVSLPTDLLDVLIAKLSLLTAEQRAVLELAACAGERFDPAALLVELPRSRSPAASELFATLHALEQLGLLDMLDAQFRFAHPRLRAAAYTHIEPFRRKQIHTALGRRMLARAGGASALLEAPGEQLFGVVDQLTAGLDLDDLDDDAPGPEHRELAELATRAGERALDGAAWGTARRYFRGAVELLGRGPSTDRLGFRAHFGHAQTLQLDHQFELADAAFEAVLAGELEPLEQARVIARRLQVLAHTGQTLRAVELGFVGLRSCGLEFDESRPPAQLRAELLELAEHTTLEHLLALPRAHDARVLALFDILDPLNGLTFTANRLAFLQLSIEHLRLAFEHGRHPSVVSVLHHIGFALLGSAAFDEARRLSETALALARTPEFAGREQLVAARSWMLFVGPCFRPFVEFAEQVVDAHRHAIETGDLVDASFKGALGLLLALEAGVHISEVRSNFERFHAAHERWGSADMLGVAGGARWLIEQFTGEPVGERAQRLPTIAEFDDLETSTMIRYGAVINKVWAAVLLGEHEWAWTEAEQIADDYQDTLFGSWAGPRFAMFDAVLIGERLRELDEPAQREQLLARLQLRRDSLAQWAARGPENYESYLHIAEAELARVHGDVTQAVRLLERVRHVAGERGRAYVEALACLRLASLGEQLEWRSMAEGALRGAARAFERWGAWELMRRVEQRLGAPADARAAVVEPASQHASAPALPALDLVAVLDTVRSISEDLRLEEVITRVLHSAIESAGADRGLLLLEREGELAVVAEGRAGRTTAFLGQSFPLAHAREQLPTSIVHYVQRTGSASVVDDALADPRFCNDPYVRRAGVRSLLCMEIVKQSSRLGVLVLENRLHAGTFTQARLETSQILLAQAASALDNARLYAELARNEVQWRSLVDGAPDVITLLDEQGRIEFINHLSPLAIDPRTLIGEPGDKLLEPRSAAAWRRALSEVSGTGERRELELCVAPDGSPPRWTMTRLAAIHVDGKLRRVLSIATDITERKDLEGQLRQQQRLESLGTLAAGVAHEINNPVQGILNYAELISDRADDPETVREFADEITTESQRVAMIVRHLLVFGRQDAERNLERIDPRKLIEGTLALIGAVIRKDDIELELALDSREAALRCRPQQIQQIIMNLVTNARDALNLRFAGYHPDKRIRIVTAPFERGGEAWLRIGIEDQGGGISEAVLAHIFDPFFTTKGRDQGTGLGLSVSHGIATEHGGELRVESEPGVGTRVLLELPGLSLTS